MSSTTDPDRSADAATDDTGEGKPNGAHLSDHQTELDWLQTNWGALEAYEDEWVTVAGQQIVGHGPTMTDALREARERGHDDPLLVPVMPADTIFIG
jgi:hypothetical protein